MLLLAPLAAMIPLAVLASVLIIVAWNMSEVDHFRTLLRAPRSDIAVLMTTFGLTVLADLTVAVGVGMVLAAFLFMKRMSEVTNVAGFRQELDDTDAPLDDGRVHQTGAAGTARAGAVSGDDRIDRLLHTDRRCAGDRSDRGTRN
jgi:MFS superfamily sulfate permease-like transporter